MTPDEKEAAIQRLAAALFGGLFNSGIANEGPEQTCLRLARIAIKQGVVPAVNAEQDHWVHNEGLKGVKHPGFPWSAICPPAESKGEKVE